ncbi:hypothetical protein [Marilutibacter chinensis]|uniref:UrcA family protein n=1 Tax=Marilutibacter chinensis TaxID=2912247 RepID=A0ABS9HRB4_9GAMM|nr:hypothetical protein [Lysobacter chinensis]MCF7220842.1 hypothetical protein [Lysobacter chinensis]
MLRPLPLSRLLMTAVLLAALPAVQSQAQDSVVVQAENVRYDYAQVLRVTPVYQTLTATRTEEECDQSPRPPSESDSRLSRMVGAVRDALTRNGGREEEGESEAIDCRAVQVEREFHRPIAYDVDYLYKGAKYRSRLRDDPGNRLRIRVSITPVVPVANDR